MTYIKEIHKSRGEDGSIFSWELFRSPANKVSRRLIIVPGLTSRNHQNYRSLYDAMAVAVVEMGGEAVTLAARGQLGSEGLYSFPNCVQDVITIAREWSPEEKVALFGRSAGGPIALRSAQILSSPRVLIWGAARRCSYEQLFGPTSDGSYLRACEEYGTRMCADFYESLFFPEDEIRKVQCPVWMGIGDQDEHSNAIEQLGTLMQSRRDGNLLFVIKGARHLVSVDGSEWKIMRQLLCSFLSFNG